jgi:hypothetical protein
MTVKSQGEDDLDGLVCGGGVRHAHLYFKRARASALLLGTASELVELIGRQLETSIS